MEVMDGEDVIKPWIDGEGGEREPRHQTRTGLVGEVVRSATNINQHQ